MHPSLFLTDVSQGFKRAPRHGGSASSRHIRFHISDIMLARDQLKDGVVVDSCVWDLGVVGLLNGRVSGTGGPRAWREARVPERAVPEGHNSM